MECRSIEVMVKGLMSFFNTPVLQHAITPKPRSVKTCRNLGIALFIGDSQVNSSCVISAITPVF
jgi:hypothetical protein